MRTFTLACLMTLNACGPDVKTSGPSEPSSSDHLSKKSVIESDKPPQVKPVPVKKKIPSYPPGTPNPAAQLDTLMRKEKAPFDVKSIECNPSDDPRAKEMLVENYNDPSGQRDTQVAAIETVVVCTVNNTNGMRNEVLLALDKDGLIIGPKPAH